jgi:hypothetical protein
MTPFGARSTGGVWAAPTGSVARFAAHHFSNEARGLISSFRSSGMPRSLLWRAASFCTERYASMPLTGEAPFLIQTGA